MKQLTCFVLACELILLVICFRRSRWDGLIGYDINLNTHTSDTTEPYVECLLLVYNISCKEVFCFFISWPEKQ